MSIKLLCLILAIVCFILKAFGVTSRVDFMNLGFAFVTASMIF